MLLVIYKLGKVRYVFAKLKPRIDFTIIYYHGSKFCKRIIKVQKANYFKTKSVKMLKVTKLVSLRSTRFDEDWTPTNRTSKEATDKVQRLIQSLESDERF